MPGCIITVPVVKRAMASKTLAMMRRIPDTPVMINSQETRHFHAASTHQLHHSDH
jgi:hypothetical protein